MIIALCVFVLAYRYYSAFLAAKVLVLSQTNKTPAEKLNDGHDYHPTNKWILFGHHFAAIAGAGPLIGPVLAAQFGFLPGALNWCFVAFIRRVLRVFCTKFGISPDVHFFKTSAFYYASYI
ncbi:hypothetical protein HZC34_05260 [Candidatus Saganbacteria bacterium]|nr:hypothetical protein [Candidatus Saganbacteria bacterium]